MCLWCRGFSGAAEAWIRGLLLQQQRGGRVHHLGHFRPSLRALLWLVRAYLRSMSRNEGVNQSVAHFLSVAP